MEKVTIVIECNDCQVVNNAFEIECPYLYYFHNPEEKACVKDGHTTKDGLADLFAACPCKKDGGR